MPAPKLLAFDSSTEWLSIAACRGETTATFGGPGAALVSEILLPRVRAALAELELALIDLDAIAFGAGPGAFTGLRAAAAVAQGLAWGLQRPVIAIDSLMLVAQAAAAAQVYPPDTELAVVVDARMGEVYAARYRSHAMGGWQTLQAPGLWAPAALASAWDAFWPDAWVGNGVALLADWLGQRGAPSAPFWPAEDPARAAALLGLARQAWLRGEHQTAAEGLPIYVRDKVALTQAERALHAAIAKPR